MNREDALEAIKWSLGKGKEECGFQPLIREASDACTQQVTCSRPHRETDGAESSLLILGPGLFPNLMLPKRFHPGLLQLWQNQLHIPLKQEAFWITCGG